MIVRLRRRLIEAAMLSLLLVLAVIVGLAGAANYQGVVTEADWVLGMLADNGGVFPAWEGKKAQWGAYLDAAYASRCFSVELTENGQTGAIHVERTTVSAERAVELAESAGNREEGFLEDIRFQRREAGEGTLYVFLDCTKGLTAFRKFLLTCALISGAGLLAVFLLLWVLSGRMIRPVAESYEKQKRFITDAGHEIKTPLSIISADADVLAMEQGESEWLEDIHGQVERLTTLTNSLIFLSKMEEPKGLPMAEFSLSRLTDELARSFQTVARVQGKNFACDIQPDIDFPGNEGAVRQLLSNLLDNAVKYSPRSGAISLTLGRRGRSVRLSVFNTTAEPIEREKLDNLFDRFYRADPSRSSQSGGYGIGLSIAKAAAEAHGGTIAAASEDGNSLTVTVTLPLGHQR